MRPCLAVRACEVPLLRKIPRRVHFNKATKCRAGQLRAYESKVSSGGRKMWARGGGQSFVVRMRYHVIHRTFPLFLSHSDPKRALHSIEFLCRKSSAISVPINHWFISFKLPTGSFWTNNVNKTDQEGSVLSVEKIMRISQRVLSN